MAIVYDIFKKRPTYDTKDIEKKRDLAYGKAIEDAMNSVADTMKMFREESADCDPLSAMVLIPWVNDDHWSVISLRADDNKTHMIAALETALAMVKRIEE